MSYYICMRNPKEERIERRTQSVRARLRAIGSPHKAHYELRMCKWVSYNASYLEGDHRMGSLPLEYEDATGGDGRGNKMMRTVVFFEWEEWLT